jgi:hypothetical protein
MIKDHVKKQSFDYELIAMAYHESGHVVCGIYNYLYIFNANVMTPKRLEGTTDFYAYSCGNIEDEDLKRMLAINELQVLYAGLISERIYYKDICGSSKFPMHLKIGSSSDISAASHIIREQDLVSPGKKTFLFKKQIQYDVEQLLIENWDAVKAIAHNLYKKKRLSFDELKYILTRRTDHKDLWKDKFKKIKSIHNDNCPSEDFVKDLMMEDAIFSI